MFDLFPRSEFEFRVLLVLCNLIILSLGRDEPGHPLVHPPECPMVEMEGDPAAAQGDNVIAEDIASRGVAVGSVALVESSDGKVGRLLSITLVKISLYFRKI